MASVIPIPKQISEYDGSIKLSAIHWIFSEKTDDRVKKAAHKIMPDTASGTPVYINSANGNSEEYTVKVAENYIKIASDGSAGAFYGLQTLKQMLTFGCDIPICEISDSPDLKIRGFYWDITRGRVPKLSTFKRVVDSLANFKINMLQLYVENVYEFEEYKGITKPENSITSEEIRELDLYCKENFIELVPSLSTFGHLYDLLQSDKYKHLCELENYTPISHYWREKMAHHTIDVSNPESTELIESITSQYASLFSSDSFNICCDETFDLCKGKNIGLSADEEYIKFTKKIKDFLHKKGKNVQMWADIALKNPKELSNFDDITFLNWDYSASPCEENIKKVADTGAKQILCPGVHSWLGFVMYLPDAENNISKISGYAKKYGAEGILNTAWGDYGHISPWNAYAYGMIIGAEKSWNLSEELPNGEFEQSANKLLFGTDEINVISSLRTVASKELYCLWNQITHKSFGSFKAGYDKNFPDAEKILKMIKIYDTETEKLKKYAGNEKINEIKVAIDGLKITALAALVLSGEKNTEYREQLDKWYKDYSEIWNKESKPSELWRIKEFLFNIK